jgi:hypothetical protein
MAHFDSKMTNSTASASTYSKRSGNSDSSMSLGLDFTKIDDDPSMDPGISATSSNEDNPLSGEGWLGSQQLSSMFRHTFAHHDLHNYIVTNKTRTHTADDVVQASPRFRSPVGSPSSGGSSPNSTGSPTSGSPSNTGRGKSNKYSVVPNLNSIDELDDTN